MASILIQMPDMGLNASVPQNEIDDREAGQDTSNIFYEDGIITIPYGFSQMSSGGLPLNGVVGGVFKFAELSGQTHIIVVTPTDIYRRNYGANTWSAITGTTLAGNVYEPLSFAVVGHTDGLKLDGTGENWYYHLLVCDGGTSNIQRWAGRLESRCYDLGGGLGYHSIASHRAKQVNLFMSHVILLNAQEYDGVGWNENPQRVRYGSTGLLETNAYTGSYAGFKDLIDTGGKNLWSASLGNDLIVYQDNSIWGLNYIGGTTVFSPQVYIPSLGLLAPYLLVSNNNVHYFVGNDYNVYAYYGGATKLKIGDKIKKLLEDNIDPDHINRCWMSVDANNKKLWIFVVTSGNVYSTRAYMMDMKTGAWQEREFTKNISSVALAGTQTYDTGETYQDVLDSTGDATVSDGTTGPKSGYFLKADDLTLSSDPSSATWEAGGLVMKDATANWADDFTVGDIMRVADGSKYTNTQAGTHYYTIQTVADGSVSLETRDTDLGVATNAAAVPASVCWGIYNDD